MTMLVLVDGESKPDTNVQVGYELASRFDQSLVVLHVMLQKTFDALRESAEYSTQNLAPGLTYDIEHQTGDRNAEEATIMRGAGEKAAKTVAKDVLEETFDDADNVTAAGRVGNPSKIALEEAEERQSTHLIIGGRKRSPVGKAVFGSITQSILLEVDIPVITVPKGTRTESTEGPIVAAIDRSERGKRVVKEAKTVADAIERELHVVHVLSRSEFVELERTSTEKTGKGVPLEDIRELASQIAAETAEQVVEDFVPVGRVGKPSGEILDYADSVNARFVALSGRKRSPIGKVLFGSVTQSVLLNAERPIVTTMNDS